MYLIYIKGNKPYSYSRSIIDTTITYNNTIDNTISSTNEYDEPLSNTVREIEQVIDLTVDRIVIIIAQDLVRNSTLSNGLLHSLRLAIHIRLSMKDRIANAPIFIVYDNTDSSNLIDFNIPETFILLSKGVCRVQEEKLKITYDTNEQNYNEDEQVQQTKRNLLAEFEEQLGGGDFRNPILKYLNVRPTDATQNRHSIANEWGAWSLARTAGMPDADLPTLSNDLYFKYLVAKYQPQRTQSNETLNYIEKPLKVLLIDDQANKGWEKVLHWIFKHKILKNTTYDFSITPILSTEDVKDTVINEDWDLIFLDLRIPTENDGKELLKKIKELRPDHQVIIFTASNKAWNHKELYNLGADGYFIKEHPEQANSDYSKGNYKNLLDTIKSCLDNGEKLKWFWQHIAMIENCTVNIIAEEGFPNAADKIATRLKERLRMFYGLLKRAHQQTKFDETNFYYSDFELAFMTLWSCFNEIQQNYYTKTGQNNTLKWVLKCDNNIVFIENKKHCVICSNGLYSIIPNYTQTNGDRDIGAQIAFIILKHPSLTNYENSLLLNLYKLKEKRNELYLTHGDDNPNSTFYQNKTKCSSQITEADCKQLFKIVYFVLTGTIIT